MQYKLIYLARRAATVSIEDWPRTWRSHAVFASQFPAIGTAITSLYYCNRVRHPTLDGDPFDPPEASRDYDGVAVAASNTPEGLAGELSEEDLARVFEDELRVFSTTTPNFSFRCQESLLWGGSPGQAAVIRFLARRPGISGEEFADRWNGDHGSLVTRAAGMVGGVTRYVHNSLIKAPPPGYEYDGISELWFDSEEAAVRSFVDGAFAPVARDLAEFCDLERSVTMLTSPTHRWPKA